MSVMEYIAELTEKKFNEMYTVEDILKGDTIEMMKEARKLVCKELDSNVQSL